MTLTKPSIWKIKEKTTKTQHSSSHSNFLKLFVINQNCSLTIVKSLAAPTGPLKYSLFPTIILLQALCSTTKFNARRYSIFGNFSRQFHCLTKETQLETMSKSKGFSYDYDDVDGCEKLHNKILRVPMTLLWISNWKCSEKGRMRSFDSISVKSEK